MTLKLTLVVLPENLTICKLDSRHNIPEWVLSGNFYAITRTPDELSIVCEAVVVPAEIEQEGGWRVLKVEGPLDFSLIGILANLTAILAQADVSVFAISTFDTDYLLVKADKLSKAMVALQQAGHTVCLA